MIRPLLALALAFPGTAIAHHGDSRAQAEAIRQVQQERALAASDDVAGQLRAAQAAIAARRDAAAQEWLERAEVRLLSRAAVPVGGTAVLTGPAAHVAAARRALGAHDNARAGRELEAALSLLGQAAAR